MTKSGSLPEDPAKTENKRIEFIPGFIPGSVCYLQTEPLPRQPIQILGGFRPACRQGWVFKPHCSFSLQRLLLKGLYPYTSH